MSRVLIVLLFSSVFINIGCETCQRCSYTYTETVIVSTPNGEEEQTETKTGFVIDSTGAAWSEECIKNDEEFSIEAAYEAEAAISTLENFEYTCEEF